MSIKFACSCGKAYKVPEKFSGKRVKCKDCGEAIRVPSQSQEGVVSQRAAAVSKRSVMASQRADAKRSSRRSKSGRSKRSRSEGSESSSKSKRSSSKSKRSPSSKGSVSQRLKPKKSKPGSSTEKFKAVDLTEGNRVKQYQKKREEEFKRGEGRLTYFEGGKPLKAFRLNRGEAIIGRSESCGVCLPLASVSREHCKVEFKLGTFIATDSGSTNGLTVNGRTVRRCSLKNGDLIQLGQAILRVDC